MSVVMDVDNVESNVAGIIIRITLKNFMCHEHLQVNFNRHINFICGKNGSGKSAILTGLVIGLGGRSSDTSRGSSLKGLIKCGKSQASIEVTLSNEGPEAYKPELFGNEITITRIISNSHGQYKICGKYGKTQQCKRLELDKILALFKIQINNPICVLNQEMAKSFIKTANPKDLYKFFMSSTLLSELEEKIIEIQNSTLPALTKSIQDKEAELKFANRDLEEIKQKHEKKQQLMERERKLEQLSIEHDWSLVHHTRKEFNRFKARLDQVQEILSDLQRKIQNKDGSEKELISKREQLKNSLNELNRKKDNYGKKVLEVETNCNNAHRKYVQVLEEKKLLEIKLKKQQEDIEKIYERLQLLDSQNAEAAAKREQILAKKESLKKRIHELKSIVSTNDNHRRNLIISLQKKSEEVSVCESSWHQLSSNIDKTKKRIKELQSHSSDLSCFTDYMPRLIEEIDRIHAKGMFERKPVGPLGFYIKLNEAAKAQDISFGPVIEAILGRSFLCGFAIHSNRDANTMKSICERLKIRTPEIFISHFIDKVHDVSKHKVRHHKFPSMLDALDISHPVVANTVIDQKEVEFILLLPTSDDAFALMEHAGNVPANCSRGVTPNSVFYPAPNFRSYHLTNKKTTSFLQANRDSVIRSLKEKVNDILKEENERKLALKSMKDEEMNIKRLVAEADKEASRIHKELSSSENELINLDEEDAFTSTEQEMLKDDIAFRKNHIEQNEKSLQRIETVLVKSKEELQEAKQNKNNLKSEDCDYNEEINTIQDELEQVESSYHELSTNFEKFKSKKKDQEIICEKIATAISKLEKDLQLKLEQAEKSGQQVDEESCRSKELLTESLSMVKAEIDAIKEFIGDGTIAEITADLQIRFEKVQRVRQIIQIVSDELAGVSENIEDRKRKFHTQLQENSTHIKETFCSITRLRNYKENLVFDHNGRKLNIIVKTGEKKQNSTSVLSLSGGERSYSMVAFILALWQEMALPFYFLDEFDVFMDPLNRRIIINLLMMHARDNRNQQFVFFTPNDFQVEVANNDVGIFRMEDPRDDSLSQI